MPRLVSRFIPAWAGNTHWLAPARFFLRMNQESSALRLGLAQMDSP